MIVPRGIITGGNKREGRIVAKKQKGLQPLIDRMDRAVDEGATEELDMQRVDHKLFGGALKLIGKVKFHMEPMKKADRH